MKQDIDLFRRRRRGGSGRSLGGHEVARLVRAVAEGFVLRRPAAAQGNRWLVGGDGKPIAGGVDDRNGAFDQKRPIIASFDGDGGHRRTRFLVGDFVLVLDCSGFENEDEDDYESSTRSDYDTRRWPTTL